MTVKKRREENSCQERIETLIEERVNQARKEELLAIYEDLLQTIWDRILPTLGRVTVTVIVKRSLALTSETHPVLGHLEVTTDGVSFDTLHQQAGEVLPIAFRVALKELVANLIDILAMLTGDILVQHLIKEIE